MNVVLRFSKVSDFPSMITLHTPHLLILHFETLYISCSPNLNKVSGCFKFFLQSLFLSCSRFFVIHLNSSGLFL